MDKAREKTDKILNAIERRVARVYSSNPTLLNAEKKLKAYLKEVDEKTKSAYLEYKNEEDVNTRATLKKAYSDQIKALTLGSKRYNKLIKEFTLALAIANQEALSIVNEAMDEVYADNYNQVAVDCKKVGIKVK